MPHTKVERVWEKYAAVAQKRFDSLPTAVRPVITTFSAQGVIDNGGFAYFFESDWPGVEDWCVFADDFDIVGHSKAAEAVRAALKLFPDGKPQRKLSDRRKHIHERLGGVDGALGKLDGPICGQSAVLEKLLETYIEAHEIA